MKMTHGQGDGLHGSRTCTRVRLVPAKSLIDDDVLF